MAGPKPFRTTALIVGGSFFMEQIDTTVITTSLPQMAASLGVEPLRMNLAIVCYLISLVIFIPASGRLADRYGTRTIFATAIALFTISSITCGFAGSLGSLLVSRVVQGISGAMMAPVGRLIMLRSVQKSNLVEAMAWVLTPAMVGPLLGPPLGGFITTYFSWHWIFFVNVPIGVLGLVMCLKHIPQIKMPTYAPLDLIGLLLSGVALASFIYGLELIGQGKSPASLVITLLGVGIAAGVGYAWHYRRHANPALDFSLMRLHSFGVAMTAGTLVRVGFGALPFLVPLMLQTGLGMTPFESGAAMLASGAAAMMVKVASVKILRRFGYRRVLMYNGMLCSLSLGLCALFQPSWSLLVISALLLVGGVARSLQFNAFGTFAYADVPPERMSGATSLNSTSLQLSATLGVAVSVLVLESAMRVMGHSHLQRADFSVAFIIVALVVACSVPLCARLPQYAGSELSGVRRPKLAEKTAASAASPL